jgi:hypothetical protein
LNEKIRELAEQSGFFPVPDETEVDWEYRAENARYEKFAELIIQECIDAHENDYGIDIIGDVLKKHFGIEEYFNRVLQKQVETTGIDYYCGCCGKPHYVGKDFEHNKECIWYEGE